MMNGKGNFISASGWEYKGRFLNNHFEGNGKLNMQNGDFCEGNFKNGLFTGFC